MSVTTNTRTSTNNYTTHTTSYNQTKTERGREVFIPRIPGDSSESNGQVITAHR